MNEHHARAYLTHVTEPSDDYVGELLRDHPAAEVVDIVWRDGAGKYKPRMILGVEPAKIEDWCEQAAKRSQASFIIPEDEEWPMALNDLGARRPHGLWVRGSLAALDQLNKGPSVSVVGARAATGYGEQVATEMVNDLAQKGLPIVSGAAYGIDRAVHAAALAAGKTTIAFIAAGVDRPYPTGNTHLIGRIAETGALVSEQPPGDTPTKWRFLARNRLIAAATDGTVVVEAGWRSGSLNTAAHAVSLHRWLGAVPGPVTSPASAGCHRLIRERAASLVTSADEVLESMSWFSTNPE